jgi:cytidylate kinase
MRRLVIAIDGPSGAGKSTAGRALAECLGYTFIDTGAMYRALALQALRAGRSLDQPEELLVLARELRIELLPGGAVRLDGVDVSADIRTREVSAAASRVSVHSDVRREMVRKQQSLGAKGGVVLDGRDIGTAVFPAADVKFYLDADPARRAVRRHGELNASGASTELAAIERDIRDRDHLDMTRADSPLTCAADALVIDTSDLSPEQVVACMLAVVMGRSV